MNKEKIKYGIVGILMLIVGCFTTCELVKTNFKPLENYVSEVPDTTFYHQWKKEKWEKVELINNYERQLALLEEKSDSLQKVVAKKKQLLAVSMYKVNLLTEQIQSRLQDSILCNTDTLRPLFDSLQVNISRDQNRCDETIQSLENSLALKDSAIIIHKQEEQTLKELQRNEQLQNEYLTTQLNTAYKLQKGKSRQNKVLAGGILILSGITTSLLITKGLK